MFGLCWCHVTGQRTEEWWGRFQQPDDVVERSGGRLGSGSTMLRTGDLSLCRSLT